MKASPWPSISPDRMVFILDASNHVEQKLLRNWLASEEPRLDVSTVIPTTTQVVVAIARDPEHIQTRSLEAALDVPSETLIVPLRVAWLTSLDAKGTTPRLRDLLRGNPHRPGPLRARRISSMNPGRARCIAGEPATLGELRERLAARLGEAPPPTRLAEFVAGQAGLALDIAERRLRGSRYKVPRRVARNLQSSAKFNTALEKLSIELGRSLQDLKNESAQIMKELIAIPRAFWLDVMAMLGRKMVSLGYETDIVIDKADLERVRQMTREFPAAILWTHKTHVDSFALNSVLFDNDFPAPHVLGGVNMAFGGLGYIARRASAIFIRRSFQDDPLYKLVLRQYIGYLLDKRFPLSWAFEGTRSRVGKLMPPRYGLLKYVVEAAHATGARNLHIIPVAINYDVIGDVASYVKQESGSVKQPESLRWFVGYLRGLRQPMGRIYLDFGKPVILEQAPSGEDRLRMSKIAFQVGVEVNRVTPMTLASLVTMILLGSAPRALTREELLREMERWIGWARQRSIRMTSDLEPANVEHMAELAQLLTDRGLITLFDEGPEVVYRVASDQHAVASYYRNTTIHYFVNKAIAELALLNVSGLSANALDAFWKEAERLRDLFKFEFFYAPTEEFREEVREELRRYDTNWENALAQDPVFAAQLLGRFEPLVAHATLLPFVEAYRVVSDVLARLDASEALEEKDCVDQSLAYGHQAYLQRRISSRASIGRLLFQNGFNLMTNWGLTGAGDSRLGERRNEVSQGFRELAHRIERIRVLSLPN